MASFRSGGVELKPYQTDLKAYLKPQELMRTVVLSHVGGDAARSSQGVA